MNTNFSLPFRQVHLDFHTGPSVTGVGDDFNAAEFARTMKQANVNSVTVFAKCHHGHLYYDTQRPERHPHLKLGLNLTGEQVQALHREGIRAPIYISIQCDEYAANTHPEWMAHHPDSTEVKWPVGVFKAGWQILDMSSPYQEYVVEQTAEVLAQFKPVDGIFFDMCWDQPSSSKWAIRGMVSAGYNPESEHDRARYARQVALGYMARFYKMVKRSSPQATVYFNSRPLFNLAQEIEFLEQVEIEALPTGGWGYIYFPKNVRYARTFPKPYMGMTARFHKSWADFGGLKPYAALEYEISQMLAHGARCSIGDQLHPRGTLDRAAYELIGKVYQRVKEREPWVENSKSLSQIGLFQAPPGTVSTTQVTSGSDEGATRMLTQLKHQFDVVSPQSQFELYDLLILPDAIPVDDILAQRLDAYLKQGGSLLATGTSGLAEDGLSLHLPQLGIQPQGFSPFTTTYIRFKEAVRSGVPETDHVNYERGLRVLPGAGTRVLAKVVEPYFERAWNHFSSHFQTPPEKVTPYAVATLNGRAAYINFAVFSAFAAHGNFPYRLLVKNIVDLLLPEPLLRVEAPTGLEATVMRQANRTIVHLLFYTPERRAANLDLVEDIVSLYRVPVSLKLQTAPARVYLAPEGRAVDFDYSAGRVQVVIPEVRGHAMLVFDD